MNHKPDEATLVAYFYGELEGPEQAKVEEYFQHYPDERKRMEEWTFARKVMAQLEDKEVIAPPIILGEDTKQIPFWKESYFRMSLGIAASFLFILVAAKMLGLSAGYSGSELRIGFGRKDREVPVLTEQQVAHMIQSSVASNNELLKTNWLEDRKSLEQSIQTNLNSKDRKSTRLNSSHLRLSRMPSSA